MLTLFFSLWLVPIAIGAFVRGWVACLSLVAAYVVLFSLDTAIAAAGTIRSVEVAPTLVNDALMILAVAMAAHGLRQALLAGDG